MWLIGRTISSFARKLIHYTALGWQPFCVSHGRKNKQKRAKRVQIKPNRTDCADSGKKESKRKESIEWFPSQSAVAAELLLIAWSCDTMSVQHTHRSFGNRVMTLRFVIGGTATAPALYAQF